MLKRSNFTLSIMLTFALSASMSAQNSKPQSTSNEKAQTRLVTASVSTISGESIRFASLGELIQIRLEVVAASGETVFDSGFKPGNAIDWLLADRRGKRLDDGSYLCLITVKDRSGVLTRKQAIAGLRDQSLRLSQSESSMLTAAQAHAAELNSDGDVSLTIVEQDNSSATAVVAHDGSGAYLISGSGGLSIGSGDFFSNKVLEHLRLTAEGNLGIGVSNPQAKLDVAGLIRSSEGIIFPDGTVQYSAASKTLGARSARSSQKPGGGEDFHTQASGVGTQNRIAKWTDNAGTLGDSGLFETSGKIGIGTTAPDSLLNVQGTIPTLLGHLGVIRTTGANNGFGLLMDAVGTGNNNLGLAVGGSPKAAFAWDNVRNFFGVANVNYSANDFSFRLNSDGSLTYHDGASSAERFRVTAAGNVGIGTPAPQRHLHVLGAGDQEIAIQSSDAGGRQWTLQSSRGTTSGRFEIIDRTAGASRFAILSDGSVGIGTNAPSSKLDVLNSSAQIRFGNTATDSGGFLVSTNVSEGNLSGGAKWNGSAWVAQLSSQASIANLGNGEIKFFTDRSLTPGSTFVPTERMRVNSTGSVGIGTSGGPQNPLHVVGNGTISGGVTGFGEVVAHFMQTTANQHSAVSIDALSGQDPILFLAEQGAAKWAIRSNADSSDRFQVASVASDGTRTTRFTITRSGLVGIGTSSPENQIHIDGSSSSGHVATISNSALSDNGDVLKLRVNAQVNPEQTNNFITFVRSDDVAVGAIQGNDDGGVEYLTSGSDYAEWLPRLNPAEQIQQGEIVGLHAGHITKSTRGVSQIMVVSTGPSVLGNDPGESKRGDYERVAFIGQVMVRVRGAVEAGDFIVASGLDDGVGVAISPECINSEQFDQVVGQAWEASSDPGVKSVRTAVGLIHRDPTVSRLLEYSRRQTAQIAALGARLTAIELRMRTKRAGQKTARSASRTPAGTAAQN